MYLHFVDVVLGSVPDTFRHLFYVESNHKYFYFKPLTILIRAPTDFTNVPPFEDSNLEVKGKKKSGSE